MCCEASWQSKSTMSVTIDRTPLIVSHGRDKEAASEPIKPKDEHRKIELQLSGNLAILSMDTVYNGLRIGILISKKVIDYVAKSWTFFLRFIQKKTS